MAALRFMLLGAGANLLLTILYWSKVLLPAQPLRPLGQRGRAGSTTA